MDVNQYSHSYDGSWNKPRPLLLLLFTGLTSLHDESFVDKDLGQKLLLAQKEQK